LGIPTPAPTLLFGWSFSIETGKLTTLDIRSTGVIMTAERTMNVQDFQRQLDATEKARREKVAVMEQLR